MSHSISWLAFVCGVALAIAPSHAAPIFRAVSEFNTTGVQPAAGNPWTYGTETGLGGTFTLLPSYTTSTKGTCAPAPSCSYDIYYFGTLNAVNQVALNTSGQTITVPVTPQEVWPVTELQLAPGGSNGAGSPNYTVVRWTAPSAGNFNISGFFANEQATNDNYNVLVNGLSLFNASFNGSEALGAQQAFNFNTGLLAVGGSVDFVVGNNAFPGPDFNDADGLSATIQTAATSTPEPSFLIPVGAALLLLIRKKLQHS